jgi:hypothetical protein
VAATRARAHLPRARAGRTGVRYSAVMRDLGTPADRFRKAVNSGSLPIAEAALREMGTSAGDAEVLELVGLMARAGDARYERAAARWVARICDAQDLSVQETRTLLAIVALLPQTPELIATLRRRVSDPRRPQ